MARSDEPIRDVLAAMLQGNRKIDPWTVNAASDGVLHAQDGPSWRMIVDWGSRSAEGVYPGGQSENPASEWYETEIGAWWNGRYFPLRNAAQARSLRGAVTWTVQP